MIDEQSHNGVPGHIIPATLSLHLSPVENDPNTDGATAGPI